MTNRLTLSQTHFFTFSACPRRFFLRYLARVPWPEAPLGEAQEQAYERGRRFHRRLERHFLGLTSVEDEGDPELLVWWDTFRRHAPALPEGRRFVELSLTVPIGNHFLTGRFDLLIVGPNAAGEPAAHIFDWKTGEPRPAERLRVAWQTRVYLAVLAEGGAALLPDAAQAFAPEQLSLTYWYLADPERPRVIPYDAATHQRSWAEMESIVTSIDERLPANTPEAWPLTDDLGECRRCPYQALTGRQEAGASQPDDIDEDEPPPDEWLEPQWG